MHLDEFNQTVDVVKAKVERSDADGEVDVRRLFDIVVDDAEHVVWRLAAFRDE